MNIQHTTVEKEVVVKREEDVCVITLSKREEYLLWELLGHQSMAHLKEKFGEGLGTEIYKNIVDGIYDCLKIANE